MLMLLIQPPETLEGQGSLALSQWVPRGQWTQEVAPVPVVKTVTTDRFTGMAMC